MNPQTIVQLKAENIKRLKAVRMSPGKTGLVIVGGKNGQGKTSLLDCIAFALGGKDMIDEKPIRDGEAKAQVILTTEELIVTRRFTAASPGGVLEVSNLDGLKYPSPQAVLDKLCEAISFDPFSFTRSDSKKQAEQLRALVGLDTSEIDAERDVAYHNRTETNRQVKAQAAIVESLPSTGPEPVSVQDLLTELQAREDQNKKNAETVEDLNDARHVVEQAQINLAQMEKAAEAAKLALARALEELKDATGQLASDREILKIAEERASKIEPQDTSTIRARIADAETVNTTARKVEQRKEEQKKLDELTRKADAFTKEIEALDEERAELVKEAPFPVPGLGVDETGVVLNGIPLKQASSAEQLRVGLAISIAMNPGMKVMLIRDGSLLDDDSMKLVAETAAQAGAQVWIERVGNDGKCTVVIEDGEIVGGDPEVLKEPEPVKPKEKAPRVRKTKPAETAPAAEEPETTEEEEAPKPLKPATVKKPSGSDFLL